MKKFDWISLQVAIGASIVVGLGIVMLVLIIHTLVAVLGSGIWLLALAFVLLIIFFYIIFTKRGNE